MNRHYFGRDKGSPPDNDRHDAVCESCGGDLWTHPERRRGQCDDCREACEQDDAPAVVETRRAS